MSVRLGCTSIMQSPLRFAGKTLSWLGSRSWIRGGNIALACGFSVHGEQIYALRRAVDWPDVAVCADGEDRVGCDGGADRLLVAAWAAGHPSTSGRRMMTWVWSALSLAGRALAAAPLPITFSRMGHLLDALEPGYRVLGFEDAAGGDEVFAQLVLARIIELASKLDSPRVLEEAGVAAPSYATLKRRLSACAEQSWRHKLSAACAAHAGLGPAEPGAPYQLTGALSQVGYWAGEPSLRHPR